MTEKLKDSGKIRKIYIAFTDRNQLNNDFFDISNN